MTKKRPGMATLTFAGVMVCVLLLRPGSSEKTGEHMFTSAVCHRFFLHYDNSDVLLSAVCWVSQQVEKKPSETPFSERLLQS